ncbi:hypothetical protein DJ018_03775 [Phenylobacterium deserti]|uniref:Uncharacterized protein n=2 Tax=Phenylobacterium deserti TaxID=1914756 RepID=A0A328AR31_9CAUL|nr:hypothetical protein DJ018_03775 [Phenylobacterium deserti]
MGLEDVVKPHLLYLARGSFASLFAPPVPGLAAPETAPADLTPWEFRVIYDDLLKRAAEKLVAFAPTHLVVDFIEERFDLLVGTGTAATYSWELHRAGLRDQPPLDTFTHLSRHAPEAFDLWRSGLEAFVRFLRETLPNTRLIFHDARWALDYMEDGQRRPFDPDRVIWPGIPANIDDHNQLLERYSQAMRQAAPNAFYVRAPADLTLGDAAHRWGLSPFHYGEAYYRYVWRRLGELGVEFSPA